MVDTRLGSFTRRASAFLAACLVSVGLVACSSDNPEGSAQPQEEAPAEPLPAATTTVDSDIAASAELIREAPLAIVSSTDEVAQQRAAVAAIALRAPMLTSDQSLEDVAAELERLGAKTVLSVGDAQVPEGYDVMADPGTNDGLGTILGTPVTAVEAVSVSDLVSMDPAAPSAPEMTQAPAEGAETAGETQDSAEEAETVVEETQAEATQAEAGSEESGQAAQPTAEVNLEVEKLDALEAGEGNDDAIVFATADSPLGAVANARTGGFEVSVLNQADPRESAESMKLAREHSLAVGLGSEFGDTEQFEYLVETASSAEELPGGGALVFPGRRMVALYGHPMGPALGVMGERPAGESAAYAQQIADDYQQYSEEKVIPAFEIIATIASASPEPDNSYSAVTSIEDLLPYVDAITEIGGYVIIDLQPGRAKLLDQAKIYEELLKRPNVGLALDPEWKLYGDEVPLQQVGHIDVSEANEVAVWLAELTRANKLPQKVFMLHQFQIQMIRNRENLDTSHPELAYVIHADGHGTPGQKYDTYNAIVQDLPEGVRMAWKNFYDEDQPMLDAAQTMEVEPTPWIISFQ